MSSDSADGIAVESVPLQEMPPLLPEPSVDAAVHPERAMTSSSEEPRVAPGRLPELDAIRGIAAFVVVLFHCWMTVNWPQYGLGEALASLATDEWAKYVALFKVTPLRVVTAGSAAVGVFFLLSGLVLTLPMLKGHEPYKFFLIKRFFRLYPPFAASILLAALLWSISGSDAGGLSAWFDSSWRDSISAPLIAGHLFIVGVDPMQQINNVMWSLVHEMRISLIFPVLAVAAIAYPRIMIVISMLILSAVAYPPVFAWLRGQLIEVGPWWPLATALDTLQYLLYFVTGIFIAANLQRLKSVFGRMPSRTRSALWLAAFVLLLARLGHLSHAIWALGAAMMVLLSLTSDRAHRFLQRADLQWLGRISYSLYLVHLPILLFTMHTLAEWKYRNLMLLMIPPASLLVAHIFYLGVEAPSHRLGRKVLDALRGNAAVATVRT
jgi:peptidoglycan/LPS O-acetylase OafA/YrhL